MAQVPLGRRTDHVVEGVPMLGRAGWVTRVLDRLRSDVELTRDLYLFGRDFGWVGAREKGGVGYVQLEVDWA